MARPSIFAALVYVLLGPIAWAAHLFAIYGAQSTLCVLAGGSAGDGLVAPIVGLITLTAAGLVGAAAAMPERVALALGATAAPAPIGDFQRRVMVVLALMSLFGIVAGGIAAAVLPACASLR